GQQRPLNHYAFGQIDRWAWLASIAPRLVNFVTQTPGLRDAAKAIAGISSHRSIPPFARQTFVSWFKQNRAQQTVPRTGEEVLLWPDTFNNYLHPETAIAAVEVLEA